MATATGDSPATLIPPPWTPGPAIAPDFRDFSRDINRALTSRDIDFFGDRLPTERLDVASAFSDVTHSLAADEVLAIIESLWARSLPGERDEFGESGPLLHTIGRLATVDASPAPHGVLITAIIQRPEGFGGSGPLRAVIALHWDPLDGDWQLVGMLNAFVLGEQLLCPECGWFNPRERFQP